MVPGGHVFFAAVDLRAAWSGRRLEGNCAAFSAFLFAGHHDWDELAPSTGNIRLERLALGYQKALPGGDDACWLRLTGVWQREWLLHALRERAAPGTFAERVGPQGEAIAVCRTKDDRALALVGETDLILALGSYPERASAALEQVLAVRAGHAPGLEKGALATQLRKMPETADALLVGETPASYLELEAHMSPRVFPWQEPRHVILYASAGEAIDIHFRGTFPDDQSAQSFVNEIERIRQKQLTTLRAAPAEPPNAVLIPSFESIHVEKDQATVTASARISKDAAWALGTEIDQAIGQWLGNALSPALGMAVLAWMMGLACVAIVLGLPIVWLIWRWSRQLMGDSF